MNKMPNDRYGKLKIIGKPFRTLLDRIDNSKGYIEGNVQWVHKHINLMKLDHKQEYFVRMCHLVVNQDLKIHE